MPDPKLRFRFREPTVDTNLPISDGTVKVEGFDLEVMDVGDDARFAADARDEGFGALVQRKAQGAPDVCIPAFPNRKFRLSYIYVNAAAGIDSPKDLEGKRVGIPGWGNTAGVWARGALQNYYEVDLTAIRWLSARPNAASTAPGIEVGKLDGGLDDMLVQGALDAVIEPNVLPSITARDPRVRRLFPDYKAEEQRYFKDTGIFPISHAVTLTQEFVDRHPRAPVALLEAFRKARDLAFYRILGPDPQYMVMSWASAAVEEQRALMGDDYWPYNVESNRRSLEALTLFAHQQGLTPHRVDYESFFSPEAAALPGA
ncbi:MAG: ABC transporter substrate-binding protein [Chloroflexi bacterium]|nr:ABC transporter substrate-binding protein [Chloroflexota bacterium]